MLSFYVQSIPEENIWLTSAIVMQSLLRVCKIWFANMRYTRESSST